MSKRIMVIDSSESMRRLLSFALEYAGFKVIEASSGSDALKKLGKTKAELILTSLDIPDMNGIDLIREIRNKPECRITPVILLITDPQKSSKQECISAGANACLVKPFTPRQLAEIVNKYLG